MYDEETRERALELLDSGLNARQVSQMMGGRPGFSIIMRWKSGFIPTGKRRTPIMLSANQKLSILKRVENGEKYADVAAEVGCAPASILTWRRQYQESGIDGLRTRIDDYRDATMSKD